MNYIVYQAKLGWLRGWSMYWSPFSGLLRALRSSHREQAQMRAAVSQAIGEPRS